MNELDFWARAAKTPIAKAATKLEPGNKSGQSDEDQQDRQRWYQPRHLIGIHGDQPSVRRDAG